MSSYDKLPANIQICVQRVAKKNGVSKYLVADIFYSMLDGVKESITTTKHENYEDINIPIIPYIGKFVSSKRLHKNFKKRVDNINEFNKSKNNT